MIISSSPPIPPKEEDIFIDDVDKLVIQVYPNHEGQHALFKKFGARTGGICDTWYRTSDWKNLSELEKWKYVALCSLYWEKMYSYWYEKEEYEKYLKYIENKK